MRVTGCFTPHSLKKRGGIPQDAICIVSINFLKTHSVFIYSHPLKEKKKLQKHTKYILILEVRLKPNQLSVLSEDSANYAFKTNCGDR